MSFAGCAYWRLTCLANIPVGAGAMAKELFFTPCGIKGGLGFFVFLLGLKILLPIPLGIFLHFI